MVMLLDKMILAQFAPLFADPAVAINQILLVLVDGASLVDEGTQWASNPSSKQAVANALSHLQAAVPANMLQGVYAGLSMEAQQALQSVTC